MERDSYPYFEYLEAGNELEVAAWLFYPGMTFRSLEKWWPAAGLRPAAHEGLDICYYTDHSGKRLQLGPETWIPVMAAGTVVAVCSDFLGRSVFVDHHRADRLISVYAHIVPDAAIASGSVVAAGQVIGHIADTAHRKNRMPAHLHLTIMEMPSGLPAEQLDWNLICRRDEIVLYDPLRRLSCRSCRFPG